MPPFHTPTDVDILKHDCPIECATMFWSTIVQLNAQPTHAFLKHNAIWKKASMTPSFAKVHLFPFSSKKVWSTVEYVNSQSIAYMQWTPEIPHAPSTFLLHVFSPKKFKRNTMCGARCYAWSTMLYATTSSPDIPFPPKMDFPFCNTCLKVRSM